jgi:type VI secretion system protein ImpC
MAKSSPLTTDAVDPPVAVAQVEDQADRFQELLRKEFKPKTNRARDEVERAVRTLAEQALSETAVVADDVVGTIKAIVAEIDRKLTDQLNVILHNPRFQQVESAWRGLHYLVSNTETDEMLRVKVMNVGKTELARSLKKYKGSSWDQSPLFKTLYEAEYGQLGGQPYGALVGDYHFDHTPGDVELLGQVAQIAAAAHAPFISGAAPALMAMDSWQELANPRELGRIFAAPDYAGWRGLRESEDAKYLGLCLPRFLARVPYGPKTNPVEEFEFEEAVDGSDPSKYAWANSAYAMAVNINRSFKLYGWCSSIRGVESGGAVEGLPLHMFPSDDGGVDVKCPTEIAISDRREAELANCGLMPLIHRKNTDTAAFIGAQSLQRPIEYSDPDASANARLAARLPYLFATCRFAHYLKCMVRDKIGSFRERRDMERYLSDWIKGYVIANPENAGEQSRAEKPLAGAEVKVEEVEGNPGYYSARFFLRPHYQLEGVNVTLSLVSRLPSQRQA